MGRSSILATERAPQNAHGRDEEALGPSDGSDSASDRAGSESLPAADPGEPVDITLERDVAHRSIESAEDAEDERLGADISVDHVFNPKP